MIDQKSRTHTFSAGSAAARPSVGHAAGRALGARRRPLLGELARLAAPAVGGEGRREEARLAGGAGPGIFLGHGAGGARGAAGAGVEAPGRADGSALGEVEARGVH